MNERAVKATRHQLRKLLGAQSSRVVIETAYDFRSFFQRGFWGRLKWLLWGS